MRMYGCIGYRNVEETTCSSLLGGPGRLPAGRWHAATIYEFVCLEDYLTGSSCDGLELS